MIGRPIPGTRSEVAPEGGPLGARASRSVREGDRAGIVNKQRKAQQTLLKKVDEGEIDLDTFRGRTKELYEEELAALTESHSPVAA